MTDDTKCIPTSAYSPTEGDPFSVEIGDWSNVYEKSTLDTSNMLSGTYSNHYEVLPEELEGLAVVFHCGDSGSRAFCAPFIESSTAATATVPDQGM